MQKKTHVFNIAHSSEVDGQTYNGAFSCKKMSVRDIAQAAVARTRLNGGYHYDPDQPGCGVDFDTNAFNAMIAQLEASLTHTPDWWDLDELGDIELVSKVFEEVAKFQNSFRKRAAQPDGRGEDGGPQAAEGSDSAGAAQPVVGEEVQTALEP